MTDDEPVLLYPLRFDPIYEYRPWGGRRLATVLGGTLPGDGPVGEAWILSDRDDHPSRAANGRLKGQTIAQLLTRFQKPLMGKLSGKFRRFPLLLKFLDAREMVSVQVHPRDTDKDFLPPGESGKTEAWVVLEAEPVSRVCVGLKPGTAPGGLRRALAGGLVAGQLNCFTPRPGDGFFLPAGTVHTLGGGVVVFEVQQNSDVTFRLYDWERIDSVTGQPRLLQVEEGLACVDYSNAVTGPVDPIVEETAPVRRERLFECGQFGVWRVTADSPFFAGRENEPRVVVCLDGGGEIEQAASAWAFRKGEAWLLPAIAGACVFRPRGAATVLEIVLQAGQP